MVGLSAETVRLQPAPEGRGGEGSSVEVDEMSTSEERMRILRMVEQGKISAEEGARLLAAMASTAGPRQRASQTGPLGSGRMFRVRVSDAVTGRQKVSVNIPIGLANMALRFVPKSVGIDVDAIRETLASGFTGRIVDVNEEDGDRVEIFVE